MIWEVDEDMDGAVSFKELALCYQRNLADDTGLEPFQLFNLAQFLIYDKDGSGQVSVDETMHMLFCRYGKERLNEKMTELFGADLKTADGDGELSFAEYIKAVSVREIKKSGVSKPKRSKRSKAKK